MGCAFRRQIFDTHLTLQGVMSGTGGWVYITKCIGMHEEMHSPAMVLSRFSRALEVYFQVALSPRRHALRLGKMIIPS